MLLKFPQQKWLFLLSISFICLTSEVAAVTHVWNRWEETLTSSKSYNNPYMDVSVSVTFVGPDGHSFQSSGYWDGGRNFKVRAMFPKSGQWTWTTSCSDTSNKGLHKRTGSVQVIAYSGNNRLYEHGRIRSSNNKRYLVHADGTPFLWIGDTAWLAYIRANQQEWKTFINNRRKNNFTVIVTSCSVQGDRKIDKNDPMGNTPFLGRGFHIPNPEFWREFDRKVQYANQQGLITVVTGVSWGRLKKASDDELFAFARYISARLAGNFVFFSPAQDWGSGPNDMLDNVGKEIKKAGPFHLVTQHPKRRPMPELILQNYYHPSYIDFVSVQTGIGPEPDQAPIDIAISSRATVEWITTLYEEKPHKPVINLEGVYDMDYHRERSDLYAVMARRSAYLSILSGAYGVTSSTFGIWSWGKPVQFAKRTEPPSIAKALRRPYSRHLNYLYQFFSGIEWWRLEPRHEWILNQSSNWRQKMVLAASVRGDLVVAYLPDNARITVDLSRVRLPTQAQWFNPISNEYKTVTATIARPVKGVDFERPSNWKEALLLLKATGNDHTSR